MFFCCYYMSLCVYAICICVVGSMYCGVLQLPISFEICISTLYQFIYIDTVALVYILLTAFLTPLCVLFACGRQESVRTGYCLCLVCVELVLILAFGVSNLFTFYVFFEISMVPLICIIGMRGKRIRRIHASNLLFVYTIFGSCFFLIGTIGILYICGTSDYYILMSTLSDNLVYQSLLRSMWWFFFIGLSIKIPMLPGHLWLPEAHVESPTEGSMLLAGIILKAGIYAMYRIFMLTQLWTFVYYSTIIMCICVFSIVYATCVALIQLDIKRLIAYISIAHMNVCMLGLCLPNIVGIIGGIFLSVGHGFVASGLFAIIGALYARYGTRLWYYYHGLAALLPMLAFFCFMYICGNIGFPLTCNFVGEFLILYGISALTYYYGMFSIGFSMFCCAAICIMRYNAIFFGIYGRFFSVDITYREFVAFSSIAFGICILGICPQLILALF